MRTIKKEHLFERCVKVLIDNIVPLPATMPLWVEEVKFTVQIEMEEDCSNQKEGKKGKSLGGKIEKRGCRCGGRLGRMEETEEEDDDVIPDVLKFEKPSQRKEAGGPLNWEGRTNQGWAKNVLAKQCPSKMLGWDRNKRPNEQRSRKSGLGEDILSKIGFSGVSRPRKMER